MCVNVDGKIFRVEFVAGTISRPSLIVANNACKANGTIDLARRLVNFFVATKLFCRATEPMLRATDVERAFVQLVERFPPVIGVAVCLDIAVVDAHITLAV